MRADTLQPYNLDSFVFKVLGISRTFIKNKIVNPTQSLQWKYIGVWERGADTNRLHFHAIMYIPEMLGELVEKKDFDTRHKKMQITFQNTFFGTKFSRADFEAIEHKSLIDDSVIYIWLNT